MEIFIFIFYLALAALLIFSIPFFKNCQISGGYLITLFVIKVFAGIAYAQFYKLPKYYAGSDTWRFYRLSLTETKTLLHNPVEFIKDLFRYGYGERGNLFSATNTYWNDLKSNVPIKIMALMNVITGNSYYANIILFNLLFLFGLVALFKTLYESFGKKKWLLIVAIFLLPSTLFWCSGIHKDGLILSAIGVIVYAFSQLIKRGTSLKYFVAILLSLLLIFSLRSYIIFALLPALFCWWLSNKYCKRKTFIYLTVYTFCIASFFLIPFFTTINPPAYIAAKQAEFLQLEGGSKVTTPVLQPVFSGFVSFLPHALDIAFLRPHINEINNASYIPAIAETLFIVMLIILSLTFAERKKSIDPVVYFLSAFSITLLLICGYTIPFTGALVRYRSIALPLLVAPLLCISNFSIITTRFNKHSRQN